MLLKIIYFTVFPIVFSSMWRIDNNRLGWTDQVTWLPKLQKRVRLSMDYQGVIWKYYSNWILWLSCKLRYVFYFFGGRKDIVIIHNTSIFSNSRSEW